MTEVRCDDVWVVSPSVALRPEPFGALAYHFGNRRLTFLKDRRLAAVLSGFDGVRSVGDALAAVGVPESDRAAFLGALTALAGADMIRSGAAA